MNAASAINPTAGGGVGGGVGVGPGGEDLMSLEAEITELQRENARVESQMLRLKSDINAMESHLSHGDRVRTYGMVEAFSSKVYMKEEHIKMICFPVKS